MTSLRTSFWSSLFRKKTLTSDSLRTDLKKCLNLGDLTFLAIGSMVGSGLYVLTGTVAHDIAGPSVVLSYVIAAIASGLSAVCYAEFGARVPVTGSAYQFTYLSVGEFWAFIIGWNVLLEHAVSASAVAKAWSGYLDALLGKPVQTYLLEHCPMPGGVLATFPDFIAVGILIIAGIILATGAQLSSKATATFAALNLIIVAFIIGTGIYLGDVKNWTGGKGFFPFGFSGTVSGAATLIFAFVGYEIIASSTEEAVNPSRDVPLSLLIALLVVVVAYTGASIALTLMVPYFKVSVLSPFPDAYVTHGWAWARYIVSIGALAAMSTTLLASLFVVPRYLFAMARDGLLMQLFARVHETTKVPILSIFICVVCCVALAILFQLHILVEFISIGQLLATTFVALCVIKLRYQPNTITRYMEFCNLEITPVEDSESESTMQPEPANNSEKTERSRLTEDIVMSEVTATNNENISESPGSAATDSTKSNDTAEDTNLKHEHIFGSIKTEVLESRLGFVFLPLTKYEAGTIPFWLLVTATLSATVAAAFIVFSKSYISSWWCITFITLFSLVSIISISLLNLFYQDTTIRTFKVPGVPYIPFISAVINIFLMLKLQPMTWVRLGVWVVIGLIVYFSYSYRHSVERKEE